MTECNENVSEILTPKPWKFMNVSVISLEISHFMKCVKYCRKTVS